MTGVTAVSGDQSNPYANQTRPEIVAAAKRLLKAGERLRFSIVDDDGTKRLSHEIEMRSRRYLLTGMQGQMLGSYLTFGAASRAGFAASAKVLEHGQG